MNTKAYYHYLCQDCSYIYTVLVPDAYLDVILDIICLLFQYYNKQQHDENWQHIYYHWLFYTPSDKYYLV